MTEQQEKINHKKRVLLLGLILGISLISLFYSYEQNFWQEPEKQTLLICKNDQIAVFDVAKGSYSCQNQQFTVMSVTPTQYKEEIKHTIIAEVVQIKDSAKREVTTLTGEKYVLENYTLPMNLHQTVKIYEVNKYPKFCNVTKIKWENGTVVNGESAEKLIENGKYDYQWGYFDKFSNKLINPQCENSTSYYEVGN